MKGWRKVLAYLAKLLVVFTTILELLRALGDLLTGWLRDTKKPQE